MKTGLYLWIGLLALAVGVPSPALGAELSGRGFIDEITFASVTGQTNAPTLAATPGSAAASAPTPAPVAGANSAAGAPSASAAPASASAAAPATAAPSQGEAATPGAAATTTGLAPPAAAIPAPASAPTPDQAISPAASTTAAPVQAQGGKAAAVTYEVAPPPSWTKPLDPDAIPATTKTTDVQGGVDYIVVDDQESIDPAARFTHYALRLVNEQGLESGSDIRAEFDPDYQTLTLHWLKVKRDGVWQDRLGAENFQVIRREENLDSQMLDGRYSAVCHLRDVRVGDSIDFAYTVKGANPVFGGKCIDSFLTSFVRPVHMFSNQLVVAPNRTVSLKSFGGAMEPTRTTLPDQSQVFAWQKQEVPATQLETRTSEWYDSLGWVQISEFKSWGDVVDWGLATFSLNDPPSPDLQSKIGEFAMRISRESRALGVIDFVQNDIRYLGIEMGANSYKPTPASQVFEHRFGDCKDKTQLCVTMLRALGIEAYPALVNTTRGKETNSLLPSPLAFNHAIVQLIIDGKTYWIDMTRSGQRGQLRDYYVDDFKFALPLKPGTTALEPMTVSPASLPQVAVEETFQVKSVTDPVSLLIHKIYKGGSAESVRSSFKMSSHEELEKGYLNYYARMYPQIKVEKPLHFQDFPEENRFEVWQDYTLPNLWTRDTATTPYKATFVPFSIEDAVGSTTSSPRTTPYRLNHPTIISEDMQIQMFHRWRLESGPLEIETPNFAYSEMPSLEDKTIRFKYRYETLEGDVPPTKIEDYNQQVKRIQDRMECRLTYLPGMETAGTVEVFRPNWMGLTIIGMAFGIAALVAVGVYFIHPAEGYLDVPLGYEQYEGIGGWLVLVCIGIALGLLSQIKASVVELGIVYDLGRWNELTQPGTAHYDAFWAPTLLFETIFCVFLIVALVLAIVLLIQKRFTFPIVMICVFVLNLIYRSVDHLLALQIASIVHLDSGQFFQSFFPILVGCAIWVPYFLVSKRVKATFRF